MARAGTIARCLPGASSARTKNKGQVFQSHIDSIAIPPHGPSLRLEFPGAVYHMTSRANGRRRLFDDNGEYMAFERVLAQASERMLMRLLAYCVMPNHWHLVVWPRRDGDLSRFMNWLTLTHTQCWHQYRHSVGAGHVDQGWFKFFPVETNEYVRTVCRYVGRNPVRAGLVERAEQWRWSR